MPAQSFFKGCAQNFWWIVTVRDENFVEPVLLLTRAPSQFGCWAAPD